MWGASRAFLESQDGNSGPGRAKPRPERFALGVGHSSGEGLDNKTGPLVPGSSLASVRNSPLTLWAHIPSGG